MLIRSSYTLHLRVTLSLVELNNRVGLTLIKSMLLSYSSKYEDDRAKNQIKPHLRLVVLVTGGLVRLEVQKSQKELMQSLDESSG